MYGDRRSAIKPSSSRNPFSFFSSPSVVSALTATQSPLHFTLYTACRGEFGDEKIKIMIVITQLPVPNPPVPIVGVSGPITISPGGNSSHPLRLRDRSASNRWACYQKMMAVLEVPADSSRSWRLWRLRRKQQSRTIQCIQDLLRCRTVRWFLRPAGRDDVS